MWCYHQRNSLLNWSRLKALKIKTTSWYSLILKGMAAIWPMLNQKVVLNMISRCKHLQSTKIKLQLKKQFKLLNKCRPQSLSQLHKWFLKLFINLLRWFRIRVMMLHRWFLKCSLKCRHRISIHQLLLDPSLMPPSNPMRMVTTGPKKNKQWWPR